MQISFFRRQRIAQLKPDIRIVEGDIGKVHRCSANALLDVIDRDADGWVTVHPVKIKARSLDRWLEYVGVSLVEAPAVERLNDKTGWHGQPRGLVIRLQRD